MMSRYKRSARQHKSENRRERKYAVLRPLLELLIYNILYGIIVFFFFFFHSCYYNEIAIIFSGGGAVHNETA